eukprot:tig00020964_g16776.t1
MGGWFSVARSVEREAQTFSKALDKMQKKISDQERRRQVLIAQRQRWNRVVRQIAGGLYAVVLAVAAIAKPGAFWWQRLLHYGPILVVPVLWYFLHRGLNWYYDKLDAKAESKLDDLKTKQKAKIEELKERTRFSELQKLVEKYDEEEKQAPPPEEAAAVPRASEAAPRESLAGGPAMPRPSLRDRLVSGIVDRVVGDGADGPEQRYALICGACFAHNGLALPREYPFIKYKCPRCGHFNPPKMSGVPEEGAAGEAADGGDGQAPRASLAPAAAGGAARRRTTTAGPADQG